MAMSEWKNVNSGYTIPMWLLMSPGGNGEYLQYDQLILDVADYDTITIEDITKESGCVIVSINMNGASYTSVASIPRTYDVSNLDTFYILAYIRTLNSNNTKLEFKNITVS